ncbi:hypothetical protein GCM10010095_09550 [Streptomyces anthocyanicus]|nr:hypothetical protein GCM10010095_09550 [Streptomyces anthocyanicus]
MARCGRDAVGPATGVGGDGAGRGAVGPPAETRPERGGDVAGHGQDVAGMRWGRRRESVVTGRGAVGPPGRRVPSRVGTLRGTARTSRGCDAVRGEVRRECGGARNGSRW